MMTDTIQLQGHITALEKQFQVKFATLYSNIIQFSIIFSYLLGKSKKFFTLNLWRSPKQFLQKGKQRTKKFHVPFRI